MSTYTTRTSSFIPLAVVILIVMSLLMIGQASAADDNDPAGIDRVEASALNPLLRGGAGETQVLSQSDYTSFSDTQPHTIASMQVTVPKNKSQFLMVEFSAGDTGCTTPSTATGMCVTTIWIDGQQVSGISPIFVGGDAARVFRAPLSVRGNSVCLGPGQYTVEVRWWNTTYGMTSWLGNWAMTTDQSSSCVQG